MHVHLPARQPCMAYGVMGHALKASASRLVGTHNMQRRSPTVAGAWRLTSRGLVESEVVGLLQGWAQRQGSAVVAVGCGWQRRAAGRDWQRLAMGWVAGWWQVAEEMALARWALAVVQAAAWRLQVVRYAHIQWTCTGHMKLSSTAAGQHLGAPADWLWWHCCKANI
jgi:hypothetical protein